MGETPAAPRYTDTPSVDLYVSETSADYKSKDDEETGSSTAANWDEEFSRGS